MEELNYSHCKSIEKYGSNAQDILAKLNNMNLSIEQIVLVKLLNGLKVFFLTYLTILNEQTKRNKLFPKLDKLLKNLEDEESWAKQDAVAVANIFLNVKKFKQSTKLLEAKKKEPSLYCKKCHGGECRFIKAKYNIRNKIGYISHFYKSILKEKKNKQKEMMIYILTGADKITSVKPLHPTINSFNTSLQPWSTNLFFNSGTIAHSIYNKNLFIRGTYKEKPSYFETKSGE